MNSTSNNRRDSTRHTEPYGTAVCQVGKSTSYYHILDASKSGIALEGVPIKTGTAVDIELHWPSIGTATGKAVVCRQRQAKEEFALRFLRMSGVRHLIGKIKSIETRRKEEPKPLFCGNGKALQRALENLRNEGVDCEAVSSPLAALRLLQDPWIPITSLVLSPSMRWIDFSVFVSAEYPAIRRVLLHEADSGADARLAIEHQLVDEALYEPWTRERFYETLGLHLTGQTCLSCQNRLTNSASPFCARCHDRSANLDIRDDLGGGD